jgi:hypothetical protein
MTERFKERLEIGALIFVTLIVVASTLRLAGLL